MRMRRRWCDGGRAQPDRRRGSGDAWKMLFAHGGAGARYDEAVLGGGLSQERFLNRQLVLPVSTISQWCVRRSSLAAVTFAAPRIARGGRVCCGGVAPLTQST